MLFACIRSEATAPPNFVVVIVDTLRADHLQSYGYERDTSPHIDAWASGGLLFEHAVAQAPWTGASMGSLWSSKPPSLSGASAVTGSKGVYNIDKPPFCTKLLDGIPTLATVLGQAGYATISVISNNFAGRLCGVLSGFDRYSPQSRPAANAVSASIALLERHLESTPDQPFLLQVHLIDLHQSVEPPDPYGYRYPAADGRPHRKVHGRWAHFRAARGDSPRVDNFIDHKVALYDGALAYVDSQFQVLLDALGSLGVAANTVVVLVSDHGEEFWDSPDFRPKYDYDPRGLGSVGHGHSLLEEVLHVPLIIVGPGVPQGRIETRVANLDIATTFLELASIAPPAEAFHGRSLLVTAREGNAGSSSRTILAENIAYGFEAKAIYQGDFKYIKYTGAPDSPGFLFDLANDPDETHNLLEANPEVAARMDRAIGEWMQRAEGRAEASEAIVDPETERQLRALGYGE